MFPVLGESAPVDHFNDQMAFAIISRAAPTSPAAGKSVIAFISLFQFAYSFTWGTAGNALAVEVLSTRLRSKAIAIASSCSWVICLGVTCGSPFMISPLYGNLGTNIGFVFGSTAIVVTILTVLFVPETKVRSGILQLSLVAMNSPQLTNVLT